MKTSRAVEVIFIVLLVLFIFLFCFSKSDLLALVFAVIILTLLFAISPNIDKISIFFLKLSITAYQIKINCIGEVLDDSWWGHKKREIIQAQKDVEDELSELLSLRRRKCKRVELIIFIIGLIGTFLLCLWLFSNFAKVFLWLKTKAESQRIKKRLNYIVLELSDVDGGDMRNSLRKEKNEILVKLGKREEI